MRRRSWRGGLALVAASALSLAVVAPALAVPHARVSYGDVRALFEARTTANSIQLAKGLSNSSLRVAFDRARITPFFDGRTYCGRDWLILLVSFGGDQRLQSSKALRAQTSVEFQLDGATVGTRETPMKRFLAADPTEFFFGWSIGHFYAPGSLANGLHSLETTFRYPGGSSETLDVTFEVGTDSSFCG